MKPWFRTSLKTMALGACVFAVGCAHDYGTHESKEDSQLTVDEPEILEGKVLTSPVNIGVKEVGNGEFKFRFAGPFVDKDGNINLSKGLPKGKEIEIQFNLQAAPKGFVFVKNPDDAFVVLEKSAFLKSGEKGPIDGPRTFDRDTQEERSVFSDAKENSDQTSLSLRDHNNDGVTYRYGLNFSFNGTPVSFDPDVKNGDDN